MYRHELKFLITNVDKVELRNVLRQFCEHDSHAKDVFIPFLPCILMICTRLPIRKSWMVWKSERNTESGSTTAVIQ